MNTETTPRVVACPPALGAPYNPAPSLTHAEAYELSENPAELPTPAPDVQPEVSPTPYYGRNHFNRCRNRRLLELRREQQKKKIRMKNAIKRIETILRKKEFVNKQEGDLQEIEIAHYMNTLEWLNEQVRKIK